MDKVYLELSKLIKKTNKKDVPVAAIIVDKNNKIVVKATNKRESNFLIDGHAEIITLNKLFKKTKNKNFSEYKMIVTLKPCLMCLTAIEQTYISKVYFYLENIKCDYLKLDSKVILEKINNSDQEEYFKKNIQQFFKNIRK